MILSYLMCVLLVVEGRSGGVVTIAGGGMDDVSRGVSMREGADMNTVGNWEIGGCAGTDGRRGLDEVGVTWEGCEYDG